MKPPRRTPSLPVLCLFVFFASRAAAQLPTDVTVLNAEDFVGFHAFSVADALSTQPGVNIERDGYRGSRAVAKIRGFEPGAVEVLIDGVPVGHGYGGDVDLAEIPLNMVERIYIHRGGGPVSETGAGAGGTIYIETARPERRGLATRLETGVGRDGVKWSSGRMEGRGYLGDFTFSGGLRESSGFMLNEALDMTNFFGNVSRSFGGKGYWNLEYGYREAEVGLPNGTTVPFSLWDGTAERTPVKTEAYQLAQSQHVRLAFGSPAWLGGRAYASYTRRYRDAEEFESRDGAATLDSETRASVTEASFHRERFAIGAEMEELDRDVFPFTRESIFQTAAWMRYDVGPDKLRLSPGVRWTRDSKFGSAWSPRAVAFARVLPWLGFSASGGRAFREPSFDERFRGSGGALPNPGLDPETGWNADFGVSLGTGSATATATAFLGDMEDVIGAENGKLVNRGRRETYGVETTARIETGSETRWAHLVLDGNFTLVRSRVDLGDGAGERESALTPRQTAIARLTHHLPLRIDLINELRFQDEQFSDVGRSGLRLPSTNVWNIRLHIHIHEAVLFASVENALAERYADDVVRVDTGAGVLETVPRPQPGRTFFLGVTIRFID